MKDPAERSISETSYIKPNLYYNSIFQICIIIAKELSVFFEIIYTVSVEFESDGLKIKPL